LWVTVLWGIDANYKLLRQKKNYGNSNNKENPLKETKILQRYYNSIITNLKFQHKPKYHLSKILISK
jgi:hypothetical protein